MLTCVAAGALAVGAAACQQSLPDEALVTRLRILGIRAEPPEVAPGDTTRLDALVADPKGGGRAQTWAWALCTPDPAAGVSSCADPTRLVPLGTGTSETLVVPTNALDAVPVPQQAKGIDAFVVLQVSAPPSDHEIGFKRLRISRSSTPNGNPRIAALRVGGSGDDPLSVTAGEQVSFLVATTAGAAQPYTDAAGVHSEDLSVQWLVSGGTVDRFTTYVDSAEQIAISSWTADHDAASAPTTLWAVLHDGRGGIDWASRMIVPTSGP